MRILITNDDGIGAPIIKKLAQKVAAYGEVTVVAPKGEQSGRSQGIDFRRAVEIKRVDFGKGVEAYSMDSTPADCVRYGVIGHEREYDLGISGIHCGYNLGNDIAYSGTIGAILEGARLGIRGLALSAEPDALDDALDSLDTVFDYIKRKRLYDYCLLYNVNIPIADNGIPVTRQGGIYFTDEFEYIGNDMYEQKGHLLESDSRDLSIDTDAVRNNYISITPLTAERTNFDVFRRLRGE